jgi:hypothetical protein
VEVDDKLKLDYEQTCQQIRAFTDIRFKLLAFVPTLTGAAVALVSRVTDQWTVLAVGLLGLFVTRGIVFYEMRNTGLYNAAVDRAKCLEVSLSLPIATPGKKMGGLFSERPPTPTWFKIPVRHGLALAFVYSAALGGWAYIVANSLLTLLSQQRAEVDTVNSLASILAAMIVALLFAREWHRFDEPTSLNSNEGKESAMRETDDPDSFDILSAIWIMTNRDEQPLMFYGDVAYRLERSEDEMKDLVEGQKELFRLGLPKGRLNEWKCNKLVQAGFPAEEAPEEWQCSKYNLQPGKTFPAWLDEKTGQKKELGQVRNALNEIGEDDIFRSQWRLRKDDPAAPQGIIEWGLAYLDRRRKARLEAQKADLETLEVNIRKRHIWLVAVVGAISGIGVIANILVNVLLP